MAIVRIPKINNYTIMSNHHLTDPALSLKAKGLMSYMLSRPDNWDFTIEGLACQNKEGADAIARVIRELEGRGYITRCRVRNQAGKFTDMEYKILECPLKAASSAPAPEKPVAEKPVPKHPLPENPVVDSPDADSPIPESAGQIITEPPKTERIKTEQPNLDRSKTDPSIPDSAVFSAPTGIDGLRKRLSVRQLTAEVRYRIGYDELKAVYGQEDMDSMLSLIVEVLTSRREYFSMSGGRMPAELVRERFQKLNSHHIQYVFDCMKKSRSEMHNIKQYLLAALFNAPATMDTYYRARVNHDWDFVKVS